jgi:hypothetical protein
MSNHPWNTPAQPGPAYPPAQQDYGQAPTPAPAYQPGPAPAQAYPQAQPGPAPAQAYPQAQPGPAPAQAYPQAQPGPAPAQADYENLASQFAETEAFNQRLPFLSHSGNPNDPHLWILELVVPFAQFEKRRTAGAMGEVYWHADVRVWWTAGGTSVAPGGMARILWKQDRNGISAREAKAFQIGVLGIQKPTSAQMADLMPPSKKYVGTLIGCATTPAKNDKFNEYRYTHFDPAKQEQIRQAMSSRQWSDEMGRAAVLGG